MLRPEKGDTQPDGLSAERWLTVTCSVQGAKGDGAKEKKELMVSSLVRRKKLHSNMTFLTLLKAFLEAIKILGPPYII